MAEIPQNNQQAQKPKPKLSTIKRIAEVKKEIPKAPKIELPRAVPMSTYVKPTVLPEADKLREHKFVNTINTIGKNAGLGELKKGSPIYESVKQKLINERDRGGLVSIKDEDGNQIYASASSAAEDFSKGWNDHHSLSKKGTDYIFGDKKSVIASLNQAVTKKPVLEIPKEPAGLSYLGGRMIMPLAQAMPGTALGIVAPPAGAALTFALSAPDAVAIKYAESLEENYKKALDQGMSPDQAYEASKKVATISAGGETVLQGVFAGMQLPSMGAALFPIEKQILKEGEKKALSTTISEYLKATGNTLKTPTMLGTTAAGTQAITDIQAEKQGLEVEDKTSRAIENGSSFFLLDFGVKALTGLVKAPGYIKASYSNAFQTADKAKLRQVVKEGENAGVYPKGTLNKVTRAVDDFAKTKEQSPDFGSDHVRTQVVTGLTQKLNNLLDKQSKMADIHKPDLDAEIAQLRERITYAKNVENPLMAELADDGTPLISKKEQTIKELKTQEDATTTAQKQVEESVPGSSVSEYQRAEAVENQKADEASNRNSLVGSKTEEKVSPTEQAEVEMMGLKTEDASELQRIARRAFDKEEATDFEGIVKIMRKEMEPKLDMSNISDDTLMRLAEDAASKSEKFQFKAGPAKRIKMPEETYFKEQILTNPKEVFKAMYTAATTAGKSMSERLKMAAEAIAEARKGKGLDIDVNKIQTSLSKFVTSKMDTDTAAETFADNLDNIIRDAENVKTNTANKGLISDIKKASKNKAYGTVATKQTTQSIDFISPNKVENPSEYNQLLSDYKKSITGEIPNAEGARQKLIDYVNAERQKFEALKRSKIEAKYDKLIANDEPPMTGGENPRILTRDEYVEVEMNPTSAKTPELTEYEYKVSETKADVMKEMTSVRQDMLKESIAKGEVDDDIVEVAKQISEMDPNKIQPKNIKLFNNIIEDVMNGERPSRLGEITSDIERVNKIQALESEGPRIRNIIRAKTIGAFNKIGKIFGYKGDKSKYNLLSLTNIIRNATFNDTDAARLASIVLGDFDAAHRKVVEKSKEFSSIMNDIFFGNKTTIDDKNVDLSYWYKGRDLTSKNYWGEKFKLPILTELNSYRMGIASALQQVKDLNLNLETIGNMVMNLSKISEDNVGEQASTVKHIVDALDSFGLIKSIEYSPSGKAITSITFNENIGIDDIVSKLNEREVLGIQYAKSMFKNLAPDLDESMRMNFGETLDMSNKDYLPFTAFFTGDNKVIDLEGDIYDGIPEQLRTMRSGTTMDRNKNLVGQTMREGKTIDVNYDFNFFSTMQKRYHESLNTAYTSKEVKTLNKLINDSKFQDFMAGKSGIEPKFYKDNADILNEKIKNYVNMQRSPYILTDAQKEQRSRLSKAIYAKLLNSWKQVFKQSIPSISYTLTEGGVVPFAKANEFIFGSLGNKEYKEVMKKFFRQTSMSDRDLGGFEAYADAIANLDDSNFVRGSKNAFDTYFKVTSMPLSLGDKYASMTSLLVGYMKGLKAFGKIENYDGVDLIKLLQQPLDRDALAYAENFQAIVNNSSNAASRAKVLREKNSSTLRLLQSYNLNQWANFNIDFGRLTDPMASNSDRVQAGKRILQYAAMGTMFGLTSYQLKDMNRDATRWLMGQSGLDLYPEDVEKSKQISETDLKRFMMGVGMDMITGGMNVAQAQAVKLGLEGAFLYYQGKGREEKEKMGQLTENTWLARDFNPVYRNNFIGLNGTLLDDMQRVASLTAAKKDPKEPLTPNNQRFANAIDWTRGIGLFMPIADVEAVDNEANKQFKRMAMTQEEMDMFMLSASQNKSISPLERQDAIMYLDERRKKSPDFDSYLQNKIIPKYIAVLDKQRFVDLAKTFGKVQGKEMYSISKISGERLYKVMNNRYPDIDMSKSKELMFMIQYGGITPEEYAIAAAYDKEGKVRIDLPNEELNQIVKDRYAIADMLSPSDQYSKVRNRLTVDEVVNVIINLRNKRQTERDIIR